MKKLIVALAIALALTVVVGHPLSKKIEAATTMTTQSDPGAGGGTTA